MLLGGPTGGGDRCVDQSEAATRPPIVFCQAARYFDRNTNTLVFCHAAQYFDRNTNTHLNNWSFKGMRPFVGK